MIFSTTQPLHGHAPVRVVFCNVAGMLRERPATPWPRLDPITRHLPGISALSQSTRALPQFFTHQRPGVLCLAEVPMDEHGHSPAAEQLADACGLEHRQIDLLHPSHVASEGGYLGLAVLSRFPITSSELVTFTDLGLNRSGAVPHTKGVQRVQLQVGRSSDGTLEVCNLHLPAVQIFGRRIDDPAFGSLRDELAEAISAGASPVSLRRTVVTGDFNNRDVPLQNAFPGLLIGDQLREALTTRSTVLGVRNAQSDHILISNDLAVAGARAWWTTSDHAVLVADITD